MVDVIILVVISYNIYTLIYMDILFKNLKKEKKEKLIFLYGFMLIYFVLYHIQYTIFHSSICYLDNAGSFLCNILGFIGTYRMIEVLSIILFAVYIIISWFISKSIQKKYIYTLMFLPIIVFKLAGNKKTLRKFISIIFVIWILFIFLKNIIIPNIFIKNINEEIVVGLFNKTNYLSNNGNMTNYKVDLNINKVALYTGAFETKNIKGMFSDNSPWKKYITEDEKYEIYIDYRKSYIPGMFLSQLPISGKSLYIKDLKIGITKQVPWENFWLKDLELDRNIKGYFIKDLGNY